MTRPNEPKRTRSGHRRLIGGAIVTGILSLMVSTGTMIEAQTEGSLIGSGSEGHVIAVWSMVVLALIVLLFCVRALARPPWQARARGKLVAGGLATCLVVAAIVYPAASAMNVLSSNAPHNDQVRQTLLAAARACAGTPVEGSAEYTGAAHPLEIIYGPAQGSITDEQASVTTRAGELAAVPDTLDAVQLVACIGDQVETRLGSCSYSLGVTFTRFSYSRDVAVYVARTGQLLNQMTVTGSDPAHCPESKTVGEDAAHGGNVNWDDGHIWEYLATWPSGPVQTPS